MWTLIQKLKLQWHTFTLISEHELQIACVCVCVCSSFLALVPTLTSLTDVLLPGIYIYSVQSPQPTFSYFAFIFPILYNLMMNIVMIASLKFFQNSIHDLRLKNSSFQHCLHSSFTCYFYTLNAKIIMSVAEEDYLKKFRLIERVVYESLLLFILIHLVSQMHIII